MALWEGFLDCWKDFASRTNNRGQVIDYLKTQEWCLRPETTKHILSIGPGSGEIDQWLVSCLPKLVSYTAVEPDVGALATVKGHLEKFPALEKHYVNDTMQTYTGPSCSPDIILMAHVAYYFADSFKQQMGRALSWLNKEGGRILLFHNSSAFTKELASQLGVYSDTYDVLLVDVLRRHLVDMGVNFKESAMGYTLDVSDPGPTYYGFVSVMLNRRLTKEETDKALGIIRQFLVPGTEKVQCSHSLFVIQDCSNSQEEDADDQALKDR